MHNRIKEIRKLKKLSQTAFGAPLGANRDMINNVEHGRAAITDMLIYSICRTYNVNEVWLRTGAGEPFVEMTREDEIAAFAGSLLGHGTPIQKAFISVLARTTPEEWALFEKKLLELADEVKKAQKETDQ